VFCYRGLKFPQSTMFFLPLESDTASTTLRDHSARKSVVLVVL